MFNYPNIYGLAHSSERVWSEYSATDFAAVAILLTPPKDRYSDWGLVIIRRGTKYGSHKGELGLPGGRRDVGDRSPSETARREVYEEIGVKEDHLQFVGYCQSLESLNSVLVVPVIFKLRSEAFGFALNEDEVDEVLVFPWTSFFKEKSHKFSYRLFGLLRASYCYQIEGCDPIWGLTAQILFNAQFGKAE